MQTITKEQAKKDLFETIDGIDKPILTYFIAVLDSKGDVLTAMAGAISPEIFSTMLIDTVNHVNEQLIINSLPNN